MQKITDEDKRGYQLDSVHSDKNIVNCIDDFDNLLNNEINRLKNRLDELIEVSKLDEDIVYLVKNTDSCFNYVDKNKNTYEYRVINDKPILIKEDFSMYEIIEYCKVSEIRAKTKYSNSSWCIESYVEKVCKVKKVSI